MSPFMLKFTRSEYQVVSLFLSLSFRQAGEEGESWVGAKKLVQTTMTPSTIWTVLCNCHFITKVGNCKWWLYLRLIHRKWMEYDKSANIRQRWEAYTPSRSHLHTHTLYSWGVLLLRRPVKLWDGGISIVRFVSARSVWGNRSMCSVFASEHICLRRCVDMMYEAVCRGWAKKNGALHHLASHCQTQPRHYTSQKYQAHPRLSNFAICWQCLHGGWFVITNSRAKINKLIYDPTCICTMKMPLVM